MLLFGLRAARFDAVGFCLTLVGGPFLRFSEAVEIDDFSRGGVEHGPRIFTQPTCHHRPAVFGGLETERSADMLRRFFRAKR